MENNTLQNNIKDVWRHEEFGSLYSTTSRNGVSKPSAIRTGGYKMVNMGELFAVDVIDDNVKMESVPLSDNEIASSLLETNDLLFARQSLVLSGVGKCSVFTGQNNLTTFESHIIRVRLNQKVANAKFYYFFFKTKIGRYLIMANASMMAASGIKGSDLQKIEVPVPALEEQERIVKILEVYDEAIQKLSEVIELKREVKKGLMQKLLTGELRLPGFKGEWKITDLESVAAFVNGYTFKSSTYQTQGCYKIITIANVQDGYINTKEVKRIQDLPSNITKEQVLSKGDILISMTGNVGRVCIVDEENCLLNQRVGKIISKNINKDFLFCLLSSREFLNKMVQSAQGGAQDNLSAKDIKSHVLFVPVDGEEQRELAFLLMSAEREIVLLEKKKQKLLDQKKYLLNNLVTGQIQTPENL